MYAPMDDGNTQLTSIIPADIKEATPLMRQYFEVKKQYANELLFFQVGDFYELFFEDAQTAAAFLGIALTSRGTYQGKPIPLCGVPVHTKDHYIEKLVKGGFHIALCDQLESPRPGTVVKRGITQVLTPGTLVDGRLLDTKKASYLMVCAPLANEWALLFGELLTAQIFVTTVHSGNLREVEAEVVKFFPDEIVLPQSSSKTLGSSLRQMGYRTTLIEQGEVIEQQDKEAFGAWREQHCLGGHGAMFTNNQEAIQIALYYFYAYMRRNQVSVLSAMHTIYEYKTDDFMVLDGATVANLELVSSSHGSSGATLFAAIDGAVTPMGSRLIKKWLLRPLLNRTAIMQRQEAIATLYDDSAQRNQAERLLHALGDFERIVGRIALQKNSFQDIVSLIFILRTLPRIKELLLSITVKRPSVLLTIINEQCDDGASLLSVLESAVEQGDTERLIKAGFSEALDHLRSVGESSNTKLLELERHEQERTGIGSLKIRYNQVHGYYIEVTKTNMNLVPADYIRQQTLAGRERFMMPELQRLAYEITMARTQVDQLEKELFEAVTAQVRNYVGQLRRTAYALAQCDALLGLARIAYQYRYVCPTITEDDHSIVIHGGRHPVVERSHEHAFIPNDTRLTPDQLVLIITGPNMGGKSTYLRQVALLSILAHMGSFVPAESASIGLIDRIFTRIGAGDDVARGKSTFLVEMEETAAICERATERSLVILDEVGRGTSTFDGMAIAQAVVEYLYTGIKAKTLFATHYHELTQLADHCPGIANYYAQSVQTAQGIVFVYKIVPGIGDGSFGIEVARMAQLPRVVIDRARVLLATLHQQPPAALTVLPSTRIPEIVPDQRMQQIDQLLKDIDINDLSPKKAFDLVWRLKEVHTYQGAEE